MTQTSNAPIRVLFLCTANSARSQIAEALLTSKAGARFVTASAGSQPAIQVHPGAIEVLGEMGIEWINKKPKSIDDVMDGDWDLVITVCDRAKESCPIFPGRPLFAHWGVPDPADEKDPIVQKRAFLTAAKTLEWRIDLLLALQPELLERSVLQARLHSIGTSTPTA